MAAAVMAVGVVISLQAIGQCANTSQKVQDHSRGLIFARSKLEEILKEPVLQVGQDQGQGVDTTTEYDWYATIEESGNPSLYIVRVRAVNRETQSEVYVWALRRPDLDTTPDGSTINPDGTTTPPEGAATGAGGSL